jgi:hypothetical protein
MRLNLTVKNNLKTVGFFQLKPLGRTKSSVYISGVHNFYPGCFVEPLGFALELQIAPRLKKI